MSKQNNLKDFLKDVADTIREKKGTDDLINPQDFSNEIANMSGSGADGGDILQFYNGTSGEHHFIDTATGECYPGTPDNYDGYFIITGENTFEAYSTRSVNGNYVMGFIRNPTHSTKVLITGVTDMGADLGVLVDTTLDAGLGFDNLQVGYNFPVNSTITLNINDKTYNIKLKQ